MLLQIISGCCLSKIDITKNVFDIQEKFPNLIYIFDKQDKLKHFNNAPS